MPSAHNRCRSNQIVIGMALFLTFFIMAPVWQKVNNDALKPYYEERITGEQALNLASVPVKQFMLKQTRERDLALFVQIAKEKRPEKPDGYITFCSDTRLCDQ